LRQWIPPRFPRITLHTSLVVVHRYFVREGVSSPNRFLQGKRRFFRFLS
jgi:hypothetical protein